MSSFQYDMADTKREARRSLISSFDKDRPLHNTMYFNKIILVSKSDANEDLASELYSFFKERNYRIIELEEDDDFSKHLISKQVRDVEDNMCVYLLDELPDCEINNAFILQLNY